VDLDRPSVARVYDYYLGGTTNWAIDRAFGNRVLRRFPLMSDIARSNQSFLDRVVRHLVKLGVRQFLDVGSGALTRGNTHQVADALARSSGREPDVKVVYADLDPVAVAHAELLVSRDGDPRRHAVIEADLRSPEDLWQQALDTGVIDPEQPVALLLIAVLHVHQPNADGVDIGPESAVRLRARLPAGSYVAISHMTDEGVPDEVGERLAEIKRMYDTWSSSNLIWRSRAAIAQMLSGLRLLEPGWTWTPAWHPDETTSTASPTAFPSPSHAGVWAGVGRVG